MSFAVTLHCISEIELHQQDCGKSFSLPQYNENICSLLLEDLLQVVQGDEKGEVPTSTGNISCEKPLVSYTFPRIHSTPML